MNYCAQSMRRSNFVFALSQKHQKWTQDSIALNRRAAAAADDDDDDDDGCDVECDCNQRGTADQVCDLETGRCLCEGSFTGPRCDHCAAGFYRFPQCLRMSLFISPLTLTLTFKKLCVMYIHIHIKFKTRVKKVKVNSEKHTQVYGMYRAV